MDRFGELKVFTKVVEAQGFSGAARASGLTPSAVSKLVAKLESRLGVLLFHRSSRHVGLTREGEQFYASACDILKALEEAEAAVAGDNAAASGSLRVYVMPVFARRQLAPLMPLFVARHPKLSVELLIGNEPLQALGSSIDIAIQSGELRDSSLMLRRIATTRWVVCASPAYLAAHGTPEHPDDLHRHHCLDFTVEGGRWNTWMFADRDGRTISFEAKGRISSDNAETLLAAAVAGGGVVRLTEYQVLPEIQRGLLAPLLPEFTADVKQAIYAIYHARLHLSVRTRLFLDFLTEQFSQTPPWADIHDLIR